MPELILLKNRKACPRCGGKVNRDSRKCGRCGTTLLFAGDTASQASKDFYVHDGKDGWKHSDHLEKPKPNSPDMLEKMKSGLKKDDAQRVAAAEKASNR